MVFSCISENEKSLLKGLIGKKLKYIKSEEKDSWNRIFGNLSIVTDNSEIEIRNQLTETEYFGDTEDVSKFKISEISNENPFTLMVESPVTETKVEEQITDIILIQDEISVKDSENQSVYEITMDDAIVIKTKNSTYAVSREWSLEEELIFLKTADYKKSIYSVDEIVSEWSDEDEKTQAFCKRAEISLLNA